MALLSQAGPLLLMHDMRMIVMDAMWGTEGAYADARWPRQ